MKWPSSRLTRARIGLRVTVNAGTKVKESRRDAERLPRRLWARRHQKGWVGPATRVGIWELGEPIQLRRVEMRTVAGPSRAVQCVFSGGPYTVSSQLRHVQVVWPPPWPRQAW